MRAFKVSGTYALKITLTYCSSANPKSCRETLEIQKERDI